MLKQIFLLLHINHNSFKDTGFLFFITPFLFLIEIIVISFITHSCASLLWYGQQNGIYTRLNCVNVHFNKLLIDAVSSV